MSLAPASLPSSASALPYWPLGLAVLIVILPFVIIAPIAAYLVLIAVFGLPHVVCELRYCDERFGNRLGASSLVTIATCLAAIACVRIAQAAHLLPGGIAVYAELGFGAVLVLSASAAMRRFRSLGLVAGLTMVAGIVAAPIATFLVFAWLHNLTPLAFVAEITPARDRARVVGRLALPFLLVPAIIATGLPAGLLGATSSVVDSASLFGAGAAPLAAFLPREAAGDRALSLFAAAVTSQILHYFAVIVMMPALLRGRGGRGGLVRWPRWSLFYGAAALAGVASLSLYLRDYGTARSVYGVAAALHSWVELPLFLLAMGAGLKAWPESERPDPTTFR